jgi:hypothetical protein
LPLCRSRRARKPSQKTLVYQAEEYMLRTAKSPVTFNFERSGGSLIVAQVDVWKATANDWKLAGQFKFTDATQPAQNLSGVLPKGSYTCIFQCFVQESLNGKYKFSFDVGSKTTYEDEGDVNTTAASNDSKVFKDQFVLEVTK